MDALTAIKTRRSVRSYTEEDVSDELVTVMLEAAMAAPSAGNSQPWEFIVVRDKEALAKASTINPYAGMVKNAPLAILSCVNTAREKYKKFGVQDVSASTENLLLAAHAIGLGAVWTAIYPEEDRVKGYSALFSIPEDVIPLALIAIGYPKKEIPPANRFDPARIHQERW